MSLPHHTLSPSLLSPPKSPSPFTKTRPLHGSIQRLHLKSTDVGVVNGVAKKRKIVEHLMLVKAKEELSDVEEKNMLDYLYTSQYHMSGILTISLGGVEELNVDNITHVVYMRFQRKEDLAKFYVNDSYLGILKEHVKPHCYELISLDYESEVEDDIMPIFRRGEEFNYGVECVLLISFSDNASRHAVKEAFDALQSLIVKYNSFIVQATQGQIFNVTDSKYTHAAVIRFPSLEDLEMFRGSSDYKDMWRLKFEEVTRKALLIYFAVDPIGTELM
ncbi:putative stress-response A/B barrel domain-containing protein HS1/DABB1 [Dioscorea sansibarensis]